MGERFTSASDTYEVDAPFAEGASGLAYRATSAKLGRRCFLKQLKLAGTRDWKTVELFEREARVLAGLDHPAIPRYLDYFQDEGRGSFILVQELVDAPSLQDLLDEQRVLTPEQLRAILEQGLEVLDYLHTRVPPVLHRDISPKNFLFAGDRLSLVDFGAVKLSLRESSTMTSAGTFGYMAPEQIMGQALPASDLYGLGMCVIALASQADPTALPLDPSHGGVDLAQVLPRIPEASRGLVEALVKPGLADRVASASEALALLRAPPRPLPVREPAAPRTPSLAARALERLRRRPYRTGILAVALLFCVVRLVGSAVPLPGQTGQLGGWTRGHTQLIAQLTGARTGGHDLIVQSRTIVALAFSPDATQVASAAGDQVLLWNLASGAVEQVLTAPPFGAGWLRFSPDGATLWGGSKYGTTLVRWNTRTGEVDESLDLEMLPGSLNATGEVLDIAVGDDRRLAILVQENHGYGLTLFRRESGVVTPIALKDRGEEAALSADGELLAVEDTRPSDENEHTGSVVVRRISTGDELGRFSMRYLARLALSPDGQTLALISSRGVALHRLGEAAPPQPVLFGLEAYEYDLQCRFSADGARLAVATGRHIFLLDVAQRTIVARFAYDKTALDARRVSALALAPDGTLIATGNTDELTRLWQVK